jgi:predicted alpha/beta hydrolase family esterase
MDYRVVIAPRWGADTGSDWYPWLLREIRANSHFESAEVVAWPDPDRIDIPGAVEAIHQVVGPQPEAIGRTLLIGHGVGAQAHLRYLASLEKDVVVPGLLCVAGWWSREPIDPPELAPWIEEPIGLARVRQACHKVVVLLSDDDPHTADQVANRRIWEDKLDARVFMHAAVGHFTAPESPTILQTLIQRFVY